MTPKHDPCPNEKAIELIDKRLDRMENKLDTLLEDKWKRVGAAVTISIFVSMAITLIGWVVK